MLTNPHAVKANSPARTDQTCGRGRLNVQPLAQFALTAESRRGVCIHEAAHAVLYALGGAWVYRVAVAPEGATDWSTISRKGAAMYDLWGMCSASDSPGWMFIRWDDDMGELNADRTQFGAMLAAMALHRPASKPEMYRQIRAHVVASLAGPAAEQLHNGVAEPYLSEGDWTPEDDITKAQAQAWLLPGRAEFDRLAVLAVETLRRADVWACVLRLADELQRVGDMEDEALLPFLPAGVPSWPPSLRLKSARPFALKSRGQK